MATYVYQIAVEVLRPSSAIQHDVTVTDSFSATDSASVAWELATTLTETATLTEIVERLKLSDLREITDTATIVDDTALKMTWSKTATDTATITESVVPVLPVIASVTDSASATETFRWAWGRVIAESLAHTDTAARLFRPVRSIDDVVQLPDSMAPNTYFRYTQADGVAVVSVTNGGFPRTLTESVALSDTAARAVALRLIERLGLAETLLPGMKYGLTQVESARFLDTLGKFFAGDVIESLVTADSLARILRSGQTASEAAVLADSVAPKLVLRVTSNDALSLTDAQVLKLILRPTLQDDVTIAAAYIDPGNSVTTWAVNARTGATTEYTGYEFNSFAEVGRTYLAASRTGLYELKGDDDAGADIIAKMKTGIVQFYNANHTHLYGVYMAVRGEGDYLLRVDTKDGTRTYSVKVDSMKTARTHVGKGVRARYFTFELESTGQDFDLEHIRFVPLIARRRS